MNIEEFINNNKEELDNQNPDIERMWDVVQHELKRKKIKRMQYFRWAAASILILIFTGTIIRHEMVVQQQITSLSNISKELAEKESVYNLQVNEKWDEFNSMQGNSTQLEPMLIQELKALDTIYQKGLKDIINEGYNERAVLIMLETYEKRLRIIEQLIYEKQKQRKYEKRLDKIDI